ncbi:MAG TPA: NAD-dependent epimerase/dehydratase family protein [Polyangiales bacterium]|nr:NAD-dependent epimerase/dehydratase family protein [Polyangiales bacterium]
MARVLVTGAAGVLGSRLVTRLLGEGHSVRGLVLPGDQQAERLAALGCEVWPGDIRDARSLRGACAEMDCVFHLAAIIISHDPQVFTQVNLEGTRNVVAEADAAGVAHLIYVSSASVTYPKLTAYAQSKLDAERIVAARSGGFSIVRPTLVYDEHGGQEVRMFLDYLRRFPVVPFIGAGAALKRPVWSEDIVDGLMRLADKPAPFGKTYNFSGGEAISMYDFARLLLEHHRAERPFVHLPVWLCRGIARVLARVMAEPPLTSSAIAGVVNDANLDPSEAMRELGYRPIGVRAGFARLRQTSQPEQTP